MTCPYQEARWLLFGSFLRLLNRDAALMGWMDVCSWTTPDDALFLVLLLCAGGFSLALLSLYIFLKSGRLDACGGFDSLDIQQHYVQIGNLTLDSAGFAEGNGEWDIASGYQLLESTFPINREGRIEHSYTTHTHFQQCQLHHLSRHTALPHQHPSTSAPTPQITS